MADIGNMGAFHAEISSLQDSLKIFNSNVTRIDNLHSQSLNNADDGISQRSAALLAALAEETNKLSVLSAMLKQRIQTLEKQPSREQDAQVRKQQIAFIKSKFLDAIQSYQQMEERYRQSYKLRVEQQFRTIKPDATPEEIRTIMVDNQSGGQISYPALADLNFHAWHQDIQLIERNIAELAQLFNDMKTEVDDNLAMIAATVKPDLDAELARVNKALVSARSTKRRLWICVIILAIIIAIIIIVFAVALSSS